MRELIFVHLIYAVKKRFFLTADSVFDTIFLMLEEGLTGKGEYFPAVWHAVLSKSPP